MLALSKVAGQPADPWGFEEAAVETWADILGPQYLDIALLAAFLLLAWVSFKRKSVPLKLVTFAVAIGYMGFAKSYLISITNIFSVIDWNWPVPKYNIAWYLFFGFTVVSTILWGRLYCGRICAYGALTQSLDLILPAHWRFDVPRAIEKRASPIKFGILAAVLGYYVLTHDLLIYQYVEPFWMFGLFGTTVMWIGVAVLLLATVFVRNLYCRFLCPVGATLGLMSYLTVFRIKRWSECHTCTMCQKTCQWGAIEGPKILVAECVRCDDCERLYADTKKCPHWRIIEYNSKKIQFLPLQPVR
ncbi:MAG: 4Fe-4S binding protein [Acidobacteria bacterium]|nr:4Fe-4S binding protein [Acidobacteriota bacterium]MSO62714.1 4Fe-4S binding protein [Acidobacteriota bacterium]